MWDYYWGVIIPRGIITGELLFWGVKIPHDTGGIRVTQRLHFQRPEVQRLHNSDPGVSATLRTATIALQRLPLKRLGS